MTFEEWWGGVVDEKYVGGVPEVQHKGIAKLAWEAATAEAKKPVDNSQTWESEYECVRCGKETKHNCYSAGHERDSSGDYKTCLECGLHSQL